MFEVKATDLAGRVGRVKTKSGVFETPALLPVVHPIRQTVHPSTLRRMGFEAVMANAYLTLKYYRSEAEARGIHSVVGFDGVVMTDSGGYQILEYGDIDVSPEYMALYEERIGSDIAVVLDRPTGFHASRSYAEETVRETLRAAEATLKVRTRSDILWVGPIQGGSHLDLLEYSSAETSKMSFDIYALGSPTEVMESYNFTLLTEMVMAVKRKVPIGRPLHLFGAGHPLTIPLAVALGCDTFDSASYIIYARDGRYFTDSGSSRLEDLSYLECVCPVCSSNSLQDLLSQSESERVVNLATHNLYTLMKTVKESREAIREGRLWEYLGAKARCHPRLWEAFNLLSDHVDLLEDGTPLFKPGAVFLTGPPDHARPEVTRHRRRLVEDVELGRGKKVLILLPEEKVRPFYKSPLYLELSKALGERLRDTQICFLVHPIGLIPVELSDIYPLSQYENSFRQDMCSDVLDSLVGDVVEIVNKCSFRRVLVVVGDEFTRRVASRIRGRRPVKIALQRDPSRTTSLIAEKVASSLQGYL